MQYLASGGSKFMVLHKATFSLQQRNKFIYYSQVVPIFEKAPPTQIPFKSIILKPNLIEFKSDGINNNIQFQILKMSITGDTANHD